MFVCLIYPYTLPEKEALQLLSTLVTAVFIQVRSARGNPVPGKTSAPKRALKPVSGLRAPLWKPTSYSPGSVPFSETVPFSPRTFLPIGLPASHRPVGRYSRSVGRAAFATPVPKLSAVLLPYPQNPGRIRALYLLVGFIKGQSRPRAMMCIYGRRRRRQEKSKREDRWGQWAWLQALEKSGTWHTICSVRQHRERSTVPARPTHLLCSDFGIRRGFITNVMRHCKTMLNWNEMLHSEQTCVGAGGLSAQRTRRGVVASVGLLGAWKGQMAKKNRAAPAAIAVAAAAAAEPVTAAAGNSQNPQSPQNGAPKVSDRTVFVRGLPSDATSDELQTLFSQYGPVRHAVAVTATSGTDRRRSEGADVVPQTAKAKCTGVGFVHFALTAATNSAIEAGSRAPGIRLHGHKLHIELARRRDRKGKFAAHALGEADADTAEGGVENAAGAQAGAYSSAAVKEQEANNVKRSKKRPRVSSKMLEEENPRSDRSKTTENPLPDGDAKDNASTTINVQTGTLPKRTVIVQFFSTPGDKNEDHGEQKLQRSAKKTQSVNKVQDGPGLEPEQGRVEFIKQLLRRFASTDKSKSQETQRIEEVESVELRGDPELGHAQVGRAVYVTFVSFVAARKYLCALHGQIYVERGSGVETTYKTDAHVDAYRSTSRRARLIVRNVPFKANKQHLETFFSKCGPIREIVLPPKPGTSQSPSNLHAGFGFVQFFIPTDAVQAVTRCNGEKILGRVVAVDVAVSKEVYQKVAHDDERETLGDAPGSAHSISDDDESSEEDSDDDDIERGENRASKRSKTDSEIEATLKPKRAGVSSTEELARTLFIRNVLFETSKDDLRALLSTYGTVEQCVLVTDKTTGRPRGNAFVRFASIDAMQKALDAARYEKYQNAQHLRVEDYEADGIGIGLPLMGRRILLFPAIDKGTAKDAEAKMQAMTGKRKEDKRNLWLALEGYIDVDGQSPATAGMTPDDIERRRRAQTEKRNKLSTNPNLFVSTTRLCVRNLPKDLDDKTLSQLALAAAKQARQVQEADGSGEIEPRTGKFAPSELFTQVKVVRSEERRDLTGKQRSKGFGFIECKRHEMALGILRVLNNNPRALSRLIPGWTQQAPHDRHRQHQRLIVDFALEDKRKLQVLERTKKKGAEAEKAKEDARAAADQTQVTRKKTKYEKELAKREKRKVKKQEKRAAAERDDEVELLTREVEHELDADTLEFGALGDQVVKKQTKKRKHADAGAVKDYTRHQPHEAEKKQKRDIDTALDAVASAALTATADVEAPGKRKKVKASERKEREENHRLDEMIAGYRSRLLGRAKVNIAESSRG
ncbi:RNA-binding protein 28 [Porphyridium purpureum]|uniref:RNA-binding protein 28 n=1 Tax=Porphyridium purpureum TaxID=35688 RepID=A0A5J4YPM7_PORPP|nr:RNA-binding protein 28 [Porphyridium purpureum]|eukprot:POR0260..scf296_7